MTCVSSSRLALPSPPAELSFAAANRASVFGLSVPGGTPVDVLDRLNELGNEVLARPAVRERLLTVNNLATSGTRGRLCARLQRRLRLRWGRCGRLVEADLLLKSRRCARGR